MKVIKRNDSEQDFCLDKIVKAVKKANNSVPKEDQMNEEAIQKVINTVQRSLEGFNSVKVEDIQDLVENELNKHDAAVARHYISYRDLRTRARNVNSVVNKTITDLIYVDSKDNDDKRENANIDGDSTIN